MLGPSTFSARGAAVMLGPSSFMHEGRGDAELLRLLP